MELSTTISTTLPHGQQLMDLPLSLSSVSSLLLLSLFQTPLLPYHIQPVLVGPGALVEGQMGFCMAPCCHLPRLVQSPVDVGLSCFHPRPHPRHHGLGYLQACE